MPSSRAARSLVQGLIDFFPKDRREVLRRLWTATGKRQTEAIKLVTSKLDATKIVVTIAAVKGQMRATRSTASGRATAGSRARGHPRR